MRDESEREQDDKTEEMKSDPKESGMRNLFRQAKTAVGDTLERAQDATAPHVERAREAVEPHVDRAREATAPHVERATEIAAPHVERAQDIYAKTVGAEFREEFTRYVNAATTTIVGLHQDQAVLHDRVGQLENQIEVLKQQISDLEGHRTS